jgi:transcriptional regulator with PAS, ATPase and Fis domain
VLIRGKSGTGKELIARGIHAESGRGTFLAVNCAALPQTLLESELFGHEKGSFTGAVERGAGIFERAGDGTIFLDEIGDVTPALQVKLLRVLQEREFTRVGGRESLRSRARVIAATNRDLEEAVREGGFREDLYFRLNVFPITVPLLCQRPDDLPLLVDSCMLKFRHTHGIAPDALDKLLEYSWPGNVRELENTVERAVIMAGGSRIERHHLPEHIRAKGELSTPSVFRLPPDGVSLDEVERSLIRQALEAARGNKAAAARLLGISRRALYSRMHTHGMGLGNPDDDEAAEGQTGKAE